MEHSCWWCGPLSQVFVKKEGVQGKAEGVSWDAALLFLVPVSKFCDICKVATFWLVLQHQSLKKRLSCPTAAGLQVQPGGTCGMVLPVTGPPSPEPAVKPLVQPTGLLWARVLQFSKTSIVGVGEWPRGEAVLSMATLLTILPKASRAVWGHRHRERAAGRVASEGGLSLHFFLDLPQGVCGFQAKNALC